MTLVKNENYWDADSINMDEMDFKFNVTGDTGVDMMLADELDFVPDWKCYAAADTDRCRL